MKSSFAERSGHVLIVRAAWREFHEELGTSLGPKLCTGRATKGRGIPQSSLKQAMEIPVIGPRWPHSDNQT